MSNSNDFHKEVEKPKEKNPSKDSGNAKTEVNKSISEEGKKVIEHRLQQHKTGKSGATDKHGLNSAKSILGDYAHGEKGKQEALLKPRLESSKAENHEKIQQQSKFEKATQTLLATARQRFGKENVDAMHIKKDDMSTALSALTLGPDVCKAMGPEETSKFGKRLIVFGIAPAFGMADEAQKQFSKENLKGTAQEASSNFLIGTAIGAVLERAHPLVMGGSMIGGGTWFVNDQLNSPEHKTRNAEISKIAGKVDNASNDELTHYAKQTRQLIGKEAYKGVFVVATGGAGIPEGQALKAGVREETSHALGNLDVRDLANKIQNLGHDALESISSIFKDHHPAKMRPATAGAANEALQMISKPHFERPAHIQNNTLKMEGNPRNSSPGASGKREISEHHEGKASVPSTERKLAEKIYAKAEKAEQTVTKDLSTLAKNTGGTMEGLEFKLKSVDSMERKFIKEKVSNIGDALRYTTMFSTEKLASGANIIMSELEKMGYKKLKVKNTFEEGSSYVGINTTFEKDGQVFELQFHTPESLHVKEHLNHKLYEINRDLDYLANPETGEYKFRPLPELQKVVEKYAGFLKKEYPQIAAIGQMVSEGASPQLLKDVLEEQMLAHIATIRIPRDANKVKNFKLKA